MVNTISYVGNMSLKHGDKFDENIINQVVEVYKKVHLKLKT